MVLNNDNFEQALDKIQTAARFKESESTSASISGKVRTLGEFRGRCVTSMLPPRANQLHGNAVESVDFMVVYRIKTYEDCSILHDSPVQNWQVLMKMLKRAKARGEELPAFLSPSSSEVIIDLPASPESFL